jgi:hypothetical protein
MAFRQAVSCSARPPSSAASIRLMLAPVWAAKALARFRSCRPVGQLMAFTPLPQKQLFLTQPIPAPAPACLAAQMLLWN